MIEFLNIKNKTIEIDGVTSNFEWTEEGIKHINLAPVFQNVTNMKIGGAILRDPNPGYIKAGTPLKVVGAYAEICPDDFDGLSFNDIYIEEGIILATTGLVVEGVVYVDLIEHDISEEKLMLMGIKVKYYADILLTNKKIWDFLTMIK